MKNGFREMQDNILNIENPEQKIYRIFSINRFKELISSNELVLVNPSLWDDPFENFFLKGYAIDDQGRLISLHKLFDSWYGQCWTFEEESDALWRIYSPNKDGVRVSTTVKKLFSSLWDDNDIRSRLKYFIGKVSYHGRGKIEKCMKRTTFEDVYFGAENVKFAKLLCIKRTEFAHENEVRLLADDTGDKKDGCFFRIEFDYKNILEDVCLDPRLDDKEFKLSKCDIVNLGCTLPITQSELYKVNFPPIRLQ